MLKFEVDNILIVCFLNGSNDFLSKKGDLDVAIGFEGLDIGTDRISDLLRVLILECHQKILIKYSLILDGTMDLLLIQLLIGLRYAHEPNIF